MRSISYALIAATAAVIGTATVASAADNYFAAGGNVEAMRDNAQFGYDLGFVKTSGAGVVELYDFTGGREGALLGTEAVSAGANGKVLVDVVGANEQRVLAKIVVGGEVVATKVYHINQM